MISWTWIAVVSATVGLKLLYSYGVWRFFRHGKCQGANCHWPYYWFARGKWGLYCRRCSDRHWVNRWITRHQIEPPTPSNPKIVNVCIPEGYLQAGQQLMREQVASQRDVGTSPATPSAHRSGVV